MKTTRKKASRVKIFHKKCYQYPTASPFAALHREARPIDPDYTYLLGTDFIYRFRALPRDTRGASHASPARVRDKGINDTEEPRGFCAGFHKEREFSAR